MVKVWTVPSLSHSVLLLAVKVITGSFWPGILYRLSLSAITVISRGGPPAMASGDKMPSTNANRSASRIRFVFDKTHLSFHFVHLPTVQSRTQSDAGNANFVPAGAKCLQTQSGMTLTGRVSGRAEVSLCKSPRAAAGAIGQFVSDTRTLQWCSSWGELRKASKSPTSLSTKVGQPMPTGPVCAYIF